MLKFTVKLFVAIAIGVMPMSIFADDNIQDIDTSSSSSQPDNSSSSLDKQKISELRKQQDEANEKSYKFIKEQQKILDQKIDDQLNNQPIFKPENEKQKEIDKAYDDYDSKIDQFNKDNPTPKSSPEQNIEIINQKYEEKYGSSDPEQRTKDAWDAADFMYGIDSKAVFGDVPKLTPQEKQRRDEKDDKIREISKQYVDKVNELGKKNMDSKEMNKELDRIEEEMEKQIDDLDKQYPDVKSKVKKFGHDDAKDDGGDIDTGSSQSASGETDEAADLSSIDAEVPSVEAEPASEMSSLPIVEKHTWAPAPTKSYNTKSNKPKYRQKKAPSIRYFKPAPYRAPASINCN